MWCPETTYNNYDKCNLTWSKYILKWGEYNLTCENIFWQLYFGMEQNALWHEAYALCSLTWGEFISTIGCYYTLQCDLGQILFDTIMANTFKQANGKYIIFHGTNTLLHLLPTLEICWISQIWIESILQPFCRLMMFYLVFAFEPGVYGSTYVRATGRCAWTAAVSSFCFLLYIYLFI